MASIALSTNLSQYAIQGVPCVEVDTLNNILDANETAQELFISPGAPFTNQPITTLMHPIEANINLARLPMLTFIFRNNAGKQWEGKIEILGEDRQTGNKVLSLPTPPDNCEIVEGTLELKDRISILIVEDTSSAILSIKRSLTNLGFKPNQIQVAEDGELGVAAAKSRSYSFIIMDNQMPNKYGIQATKEIRDFEKAEGRARSAILFDSSTTEFVYLKEPNEEKEAQARAARKEVLSRDLFDDFIPKPILTQSMKMFLTQHWPKV
ncbi:MAG: response regulator [Chlamydiae bacterium]|nr:response regulator [Chlamydiota bacterium]